MVGKCHSCNGGYPSTKKTFSWSKERYPVRTLMNYWDVKPASFSYEGVRGLNKEVAELFGLGIHKDKDGKPIRYAIKWPNTTQYRKYNDNDPGPKYKFKESGYKQIELFGPEFNAGTAKRIYLTEGAFDAAALYQVISFRNKIEYPVKAIPSASISEKFIQANYDYLNSFSEIIYAGELDHAGRPCADTLYSVFPHKFYYVPMTKHKDANEFLLAGDSEDLKWAAFKPQRYSPENFYIGDTAIETAITNEDPYQVYPTGHSGFDEKCRGLVKGGIMFIKAPRGTGKTEVARFFEKSLQDHKDARLALLHMEEQKSTTYRGMATYELGINVRTKEDAKLNQISEEEVIKAAKKAAKGERTILFEMRGSDDPLKLLDYIRLAATVYGADFVFVDHVQRLAYLSATGVDGATAMLTAIASRCAQLAKELNIGIIFLSQVNDDGRTKYAAALEEEAIICVRLERKVEAEDDIERNTTRFYVDKNRPFSKLGEAGGIFWNQDTTTLEETS